VPRIRTLKPEHKLHRKVGLLSDRAYRLWIGLITEADDDGRLVCEPGQLRAIVFGMQPRTLTRHVALALDEILRTGLAVRYRVNGTSYAVLPSYRDHQKINRPSPSKLPPPPKHSRSTHGALTEHSRKPHGALREPSRSTHAGSDLRNRKEKTPSINPREKVHRAAMMPTEGPDVLSNTRTGEPEPVAAVLTRIGFITPGAEGGPHGQPR
jgi:hypothetical protein